MNRLLRGRWLMATALVYLLLTGSAWAYKNAGFRSHSDYEQYLRYERAVHNATDAATAAIKRNSGDAVAYYHRAKAWELVPDYSGPWPDGKPHGGWNGPVNALADYHVALKLDPKFTKAYYRRGLLQWQRMQEKLGVAIVDVQEAVKCDETFAPAQAALALMLCDHPQEKSRDLPTALKHAEKAVELLPENGACRELLAYVQSRNEDFAAAATSQAKAVELLQDADPKSTPHQRLAAYRLGVRTTLPIELPTLAAQMERAVTATALPTGD